MKYLKKYKILAALFVFSLFFIVPAYDYVIWGDSTTEAYFISQEDHIVISNHKREKHTYTAKFMIPSINQEIVTEVFPSVYFQTKPGERYDLPNFIVTGDTLLFGFSMFYFIIPLCLGASLAMGIMYDWSCARKKLKIQHSTHTIILR